MLFRSVKGTNFALIFYRLMVLRTHFFKHITTLCAIAAAMVALLPSCSSTKHVPDGKYMRQRLEERKHLDYFLINDMPDHLCSVSFSKIDLAKEKNEYVSAYSQALACFNDHVGVYLYGSMGVGKTYLCACACNAYARDKKKAAFIHYPSFVQRMASRVQAGEYKQELDILKLSRRRYTN